MCITIQFFRFCGKSLLCRTIFNQGSELPHCPYFLSKQVPMLEISQWIQRAFSERFHDGGHLLVLISLTTRQYHASSLTESNFGITTTARFFGFSINIEYSSKCIFPMCRNDRDCLRIYSRFTVLLQKQSPQISPAFLGGSIVLVAWKYGPKPILDQIQKIVRTFRLICSHKHRELFDFR